MTAPASSYDRQKKRKKGRETGSGNRKEEGSEQIEESDYTNEVRGGQRQKKKLAEPPDGEEETYEEKGGKGKQHG